jgi:hypothetical protein
MRRPFLTLLLVAAFAALCLPGGAQDKPMSEPDDLRAVLEMLRSDANTAKIRTINEVLKLTGPEAERFWPVYREYEKELAAVGDRKLALIREFATLHFGGTLDNKKADELAAGWFKNTQERLDLWKRYHRKISKAVSPIRAAQFLQVEHQMALLIDLNVAAEMPAIGLKPPAGK